MDGIKDYLYIGGALSSVIGAFWIARYQIKDLIKKVSDAGQEMKLIWKTLDEMRLDISDNKRQNATFRDILSPDKLEKEARREAGFEKDILYLRRDVDELRKSGL